MALTVKVTEQAPTGGHVSHDAQVRVDKRVERILARFEHARLRAPTAATRSHRGDDPERVRTR